MRLASDIYNIYQLTVIVLVSFAKQDFFDKTKTKIFVQHQMV